MQDVIQGKNWHHSQSKIMHLMSGSHRRLQMIELSIYYRSIVGIENDFASSLNKFSTINWVTLCFTMLHLLEIFVSFV